MLTYGVGLFVVLLCCCGIALDLGSFELTRLRMQSAVDAAALGAAVASQSGGAMSSAGLRDAAQNGFTNRTRHVAVTITNPPSSGTYAGNANAVQATITKTVQGNFLPTKFTLGVQAVAVGSSSACVYALSQSGSQASLALNNQTIEASCPFYLGHSYSISGGSITGDALMVAGSSTDSTGSVSPTPTFNVPVRSDPLAKVPAPSIGICDYTSFSATGTATLHPGTYCNGLQITNGSNITLRPGTYIVLGALSISNTTLTGSGVTFYMSQGNGYSYGITSITSVAGTLSAPTSGSLQGLLFFADRNLPAGQAGFNITNGNPGARFDGIFYLPGQTLYSSNSTLQGRAYFGVVADFLTMNNTGFTPTTDYSSLADGNPFGSGSAGLVE